MTILNKKTIQEDVILAKKLVEDTVNPKYTEENPREERKRKMFERVLMVHAESTNSKGEKFNPVNTIGTGRRSKIYFGKDEEGSQRLKQFLLWLWVCEKDEDPFSQVSYEKQPFIGGTDELAKKDGNKMIFTGYSSHKVYNKKETKSKMNGVEAWVNGNRDELSDNAIFDVKSPAQTLNFRVGVAIGGLGQKKNGETIDSSGKDGAILCVVDKDSEGNYFALVGCEGFTPDQPGHSKAGEENERSCLGIEAGKKKGSFWPEEYGDIPEKIDDFGISYEENEPVWNDPLYTLKQKKVNKKWFEDHCSYEFEKHLPQREEVVRILEKVSQLIFNCRKALKNGDETAQKKIDMLEELKGKIWHTENDYQGKIKNSKSKGKMKRDFSTIKMVIENYTVKKDENKVWDILNREKEGYLDWVKKTLLNFLPLKDYLFEKEDKYKVKTSLMKEVCNLNLCLLKGGNEKKGRHSWNTFENEKKESKESKMNQSFHL